MSNCALSMDEEDYGITWITVVLGLHFFAMFAPGFFTGWLIFKYGTFNVSILGTIVFALSAVVFSSGKHLWNYFPGMMLLGVAWNFSFSSATIMLTACYKVFLEKLYSIICFIYFLLAYWSKRCSINQWLYSVHSSWDWQLIEWYYISRLGMEYAHILCRCFGKWQFMLIVSQNIIQMSLDVYKYCSFFFCME